MATLSKAGGFLEKKKGKRFCLPDGLRKELF
jgi:hypothetical protein